MRAVVLAALVGCAAPVVEMTIQLPNDNQTFDTTCITAVEVYTDGTTYPDDVNDYKRDCHELPAGLASWGDVAAAMRGQYDVAIPDSGLKGIEVYGRVGSCANESLNAKGLWNDMLFSAATTYGGEEQISLTMVPTASCAKKVVTIRPMDLMKLHTSADCVAAGIADGGAGAGTLVQTLYDGAGFSGADTYVPVDGGTLAATVPDTLATVSDSSCLALYAGDNLIYSLSCAPQTPPVCASTNELEAPGIDNNIWATSRDTTLLAQYRDVIVGAVWKATGTTKAPFQGATVDVDPSAGKVVYVEPSGGKLMPTNGASTGPSGMFMLYTSQIVKATVTVAGTSKPIKLAGTYDAPSVALILF